MMNPILDKQRNQPVFFIIVFISFYLFNSISFFDILFCLLNPLMFLLFHLTNSFVYFYKN